MGIVEFNVATRHIENGWPDQPRGCATALALAEALPDADGVEVLHSTIEVEVGLEKFIHRMDPDLKAWVRNYDHAFDNEGNYTGCGIGSKPVHPASFKIRFTPEDGAGAAAV